MSKRQKKARDRQLYAEAVAEIIEACRRHPGLRTVIHRHFCRLAGREVVRQAVGQWLDEDPKTRVEPKWGTGQVLLAAWAEARKEIGE